MLQLHSFVLRNGQHTRGAFSSGEVGGRSVGNMSWYLPVELGSLTTANLMEKVRGLQNLAYQLGLEECEYTRSTHHNQWIEHAACVRDTAVHTTLKPYLCKYSSCLVLPLDGAGGFPDMLGSHSFLVCSITIPNHTGECL